MYLATTRGSLMRATSADAGSHGDVLDDNSAQPVPGCSNAPISLIETSKNVYDPASETWRVVRYLDAKVPPKWAVQDGDRIRDDRTGAIYPILSGTRAPRTLSGLATRKLQLQLND